MKKKIIAVLFLVLVMCGAFFTVNKINEENEDPITLTEIVEGNRNPAIEETLDSMTLEQKIGQMFMGCFYSKTPLPETVSRYHLGSVLLFGPSFTDNDKTSLKAQLDAIDNACTIKPIMAVDEEGGIVNRVSNSPAFRSEPFKSHREIFASGGMDAIIADTHEKNALLSEIGIDLNLAPVCDISLNPDDFMYPRSLGQNAEITSEYIAKVTAACIDDNMGCCLKHFPGYGNSADTHTGSATDNRSLKQLQESDFLPFEAGIKAGAPFVLVSHNIVTAIDDKLPASLSPAIHKILRYDMAFDGIIITDDLSMGAVSEFSPNTDSAVTAILAGNDMLCTGAFAKQYDAVLAAVNSEIISEERIDSSVRRILAWKKSMSLF